MDWRLFARPMKCSSRANGTTNSPVALAYDGSGIEFFLTLIDTNFDSFFSTGATLRNVSSWTLSLSPVAIL